MNSASLLLNKHALVFGAGGSIGAAVADEFAAEQARVFLSGRTKSNIEDVATRITRTGGHAEATELDALDETAVDTYIDGIAAQTGHIDVVFNAIGPRTDDYRNGTNAIDLAVDEFMIPLTTIVRSQFITARAAARHMTRQRSGVIMFITGSPARPHLPGSSAIGAAFGAIENFTRQLALELGPTGVRVVCLRSSGMPDTRTIRDTMQRRIRGSDLTEDGAIQQLADRTMLKVSPRTADTAKAAAFLASDRARMVTGTVLNSSAGAIAD